MPGQETMCLFTNVCFTFLRKHVRVLGCVADFVMVVVMDLIVERVKMLELELHSLERYQIY